MPPTRSATTAIDLSYLEATSFGDSAALLLAVDVILETLPAETRRLREAAGEHALAGVRAAAHKLGTSAAMLGLKDLKELLSTIEDAAHNNDAGDVLQNALHAADRCDEAFRELLQMKVGIVNRHPSA